jgi:Protein of unknown function (DUF1629)
MFKIGFKWPAFLRRGKTEKLSGKGEIFLIDPAFWGDGGFPRVEIVNWDRLCIPGTYMFEEPNGDPNQYPERPHLVHKRVRGSRAGLIRDFEDLFGQWIVSEALKRVFESVDPNGVAFAACDYTLSDGSLGPQWYFCGVRRTLDALDEDASRLKIRIGEYVNGKYYDLSGFPSLVFKKDIIGSAHIFRTPYSPSVFCDRIMHNAIRAAKLKGVRMRDATDY